ncbi:MAG: histidine kinase dimerization/phospho-acceptor domain-containing protein, partial [Myxococcota bacterium]
MTSLVRRVTRGATGVLLAALVGVGVATAALLYANELRATDRMLLAAATAHGPGWVAENARVPVEVGIARPPAVPASWITRVATTERPLWVTTADERLVLVLVEAGHEGEDEDEDEDRDHRVVVARTHRPSIGRSVGPFVIAYAFAAGAIALLAAMVQYAVVAGAVAPLLRGRDAVSRVIGAGAGARVTEEGPDEVRALLHAVNALLGRLDAAFATQARFTADAAHELRTPVAAMLGELDVTLRRVRTPEGYATALAAVRGDVVRLASLVDGLLLLARVDAGHAEQ